MNAQKIKNQLDNLLGKNVEIIIPREHWDSDSLKNVYGNFFGTLEKPDKESKNFQHYFLRMYSTNGISFRLIAVDEIKHNQIILL